MFEIKRKLELLNIKGTFDVVRNTKVFNNWKGKTFVKNCFKVCETHRTLYRLNSIHGDYKTFIENVCYKQFKILSFKQFIVILISTMHLFNSKL